jgi:hypothetical protein
MKKFTLIFALFTFVSIVVTAQPQLTWRFANAEVINAGTQLQFDVEVMADAGVTYHRDLQVYFDYNTAGFGADIVANGYVTVTPLALMNTHYVVVNSADNTSSKFAVITEGSNEMTQSGSATYFNEMPTTFTGLLRITIDVMDNTATAGIAFDEALMNGGQYYQSTSNTDPVKYMDPCVYDNDLTGLLLSTLYGTVTYANVANTPLNNCSIDLYDGSAVYQGTAMTDVAGIYGFTGLSDGTYSLETSCTLPPTGFNIADAFLLRQYLATGNPALNSLQLLAADVAANGFANIQDAFAMRQELAGGSPLWTAPDYVFEVQSATVTSGVGMKSYQGLSAGDINGSGTP